MENLQHTPGPWTQHVDDALMIGTQSESVCQVYESLTRPFLGPKTNEAFANARLIAAAPEMLEVLHDILINSGGFLDGTISHELKQAARAAIAKATGQAPETAK